MCATSDFAASASTHCWAYLHSCRQGAWVPSTCGVAAPAAIERVGSAAFCNPPAARSGASGVDGLSPPAQSTHQTFLVDGDQCALSPTSSLSAHEWQRPPYFSEMKRRSSGSFVNGLRSGQLETRERKTERVGEPTDIFATLCLASQAHRLRLLYKAPRALKRRIQEFRERPENRGRKRVKREPMRRARRTRSGARDAHIQV